MHYHHRCNDRRERAKIDTNDAVFYWSIIQSETIGEIIWERLPADPDRNKERDHWLIRMMMMIIRSSCLDIFSMPKERG